MLCSITILGVCHFFNRSASYQVRTSIPSEKQQVVLNNVMQHHSGVLLEPATAGQLPLQQPITYPASLSPTAAVDKKPVASKVLRDIASTSMSSKLYFLKY